MPRFVFGMKRFELLTPSSQTICATKLRYIPIENLAQEGQLCWLKISALERTRTSTPEATDPKSAAYTIPPLRLKYLLTCTFYLTMASSRRQKVKSTQSTKNQELKKVLNTILSRVYFAIFPWAIASN